MASPSSTLSSIETMRAAGKKIVSNYPTNINMSHIAVVSLQDNYLSWGEVHTLGKEAILKTIDQFNIIKPETTQDTQDLIVLINNLLDLAPHTNQLTVIFLIDEIPSESVINYFNDLSNQHKVVILYLGQQNEVLLQKRLMNPITVVKIVGGEAKELVNVPYLIYPGI